MALYNMTLIQLSGLTVDLISIEIGCLGHFMPDTISQVAYTCQVMKKTIRSLFQQVAVSFSYSLLGLGSIGSSKLNFFCML